MHNHSVYQEAQIHALTENYTNLSGEFDKVVSEANIQINKVVSEANIEINKLHNRVDELVASEQDLKKKNAELMEKWHERNRKLAQTQVRRPCQRRK